MNSKNYIWGKVVLVFLVAVAIAALPASAGGKVTKMDTPVLTCFDSTQHTITIQVCAGTGTGAPAGFSIQWMSAPDFDAGTLYNLPGQWPNDSDSAAASGTLCKASFSGNAAETLWNLLPGQCKQITIGDLASLIENAGPSAGVSTTCPGQLECDSEYVFRTFAHANKSLFRSDFSGTTRCTTEPCDEPPPTNFCSYTQGGWGNNGCNVVDGVITNPENPGCIRDQNFDTVYPGDLVTGGTKTYTFQGAGNVESYLPCGGQSGQIGASATNPACSAPPGTLGAQVVALRLNVDFSAASVTPFGLGGLTLCSLTDGQTSHTQLSLGGSALTATQVAALSGQSVAQILAAAEAYLGGGSLPYGLSRGQLVDLLTLLNQGWDNCQVPATAFVQDFVCQ